MIKIKLHIRPNTLILIYIVHVVNPHIQHFYIVYNKKDWVI